MLPCTTKARTTLPIMPTTYVLFITTYGEGITICSSNIRPVQLQGCITEKGVSSTTIICRMRMLAEYIPIVTVFTIAFPKIPSLLRQAIQNITGFSQTIIPASTVS